MSAPSTSRGSRLISLGTWETIWLVVLILLSGPVQLTAAQDKWQAADLSVRRLSPTAFPQVPREIISYLTARGCTVPQPYDAIGANNVIRGEFMQRGQLDWAVLCSRSRISSILVFWNGSIKNVAETAAAPDSDFLQTIDGAGTIGYSRTISSVNKDYALQHYRWYGGPRPPHMDHQGIDDAFIGKASRVLFYYRGKWLQLQGAD
jgi:hypothetical protein